jgi:hypothetical protein
VIWLRSGINDSGAFTLQGDSEPHWTTTLCVFTLARLGSLKEVENKSLRWLLNWKGRLVPPEKDIVIDSTLAGWPWMADTFSWVEPTCLALLAIKQCGQTHHPRVREAERMLLDRACRDGGWNFGNHTALGVPIASYIQTTALALLALQGVGEAAEFVKRGQVYLDREIGRHQSALSLALTTLCFNVYGKPTTGLAQALVDRQGADGSWQRQVHLTALAVLALHAATGGVNVFKLSQ